MGSQDSSRYFRLVLFISNAWTNFPKRFWINGTNYQETISVPPPGKEPVTSSWLWVGSDSDDELPGRLRAWVWRQSHRYESYPKRGMVIIYGCAFLLLNRGQVWEYFGPFWQFSSQNLVTRAKKANKSSLLFKKVFRYTVRQLLVAVKYWPE